MDQEIRKILRLNLVEGKLEHLRKQGIFFLDGEIDEAMTSTFILDLLYTLRTQAHMPIWVVLNSVGGSVDQGFGIYDTIKAVVQSGHTVNILGQGLVASMATAVIQAGSKRYALTNTQFLVHQVRQTMGFFGSEEVNEARDRTEELERINDITLNIIARRCGKPLQEIKALCKKTDYWLDARSALKFGEHGLIDEVVTTFPFSING